MAQRKTCTDKLPQGESSRTQPSQSSRRAPPSRQWNEPQPWALPRGRQTSQQRAVAEKRQQMAQKQAEENAARLQQIAERQAAANALKQETLAQRASLIAQRRREQSIKSRPSQSTSRQQQPCAGAKQRPAPTRQQQPSRVQSVGARQPPARASQQQIPRVQSVGARRPQIPVRPQQPSRTRTSQIPTRQSQVSSRAPRQQQQQRPQSTSGIARPCPSNRQRSPSANISNIPRPCPTRQQQRTEQEELDEFERLEREFASPEQQREQQELDEFERLENEFASPEQLRQRQELDEFTRLEREFASPSPTRKSPPVMTPQRQRVEQELDEFEMLERQFASSQREQPPLPCPSIPADSAQENADQVLDIVPAGDIQQLEQNQTQNFDVAAVNDPEVTPKRKYTGFRDYRDKQSSITVSGSLRKAKKMEERWRRLQEAAENIVPLMYEAPDLDNSPLDDAVFMAYTENNHWEELLDRSAIIIGDESLPPDFEGVVGDNEDCFFQLVDSVPRPELNVSTEHYSVCADSLPSPRSGQNGSRSPGDELFSQVAARANIQDLGDVSFTFPTVCTDSF